MSGIVVLQNINIEKVNLNKCNDKVYERLINANFLRAQVLGIIQDFSVNETPTILLKNENLGNTNIDGETRQENATTWAVVLNNNALQNASQEYIAATIIHEILHVYLGTGNDPDHETMAQKYVYPMANALRAAGFNITYENAVALAWGGLQQTNAWKELVAIDRVSGTTKTQDILNTNANYKNGVKGLNCN